MIEGEFETLLKQLTPTQDLIAAANSIFKMLWNHRGKSQGQRKKSLQAEHKTLERKIEKALDNIVEVSSTNALHAFEKRIDELQAKKLVIEEKINQIGQPLRPYDTMYRTALTFLENPFKIWELGRF